MKLYKIVPKHVEEYKTTSRVTCDRCGADVEKRSPFNADETKIEARLGDIYPEGDHREACATDACGKCFLEHVVPALKAAGFTFREWHSDGNEPQECDK